MSVSDTSAPSAQETVLLLALLKAKYQCGFVARTRTSIKQVMNHDTRSLPFGRDAAIQTIMQMTNKMMKNYIKEQRGTMMTSHPPVYCEHVPQDEVSRT